MKNQKTEQGSSRVRKLRRSLFQNHRLDVFVLESFLPYIFLQVSQKSARPKEAVHDRMLSVKPSLCNARRDFSYPPTDVYEWGECVREYDWKGRWVQAVPHPVFENVTVQCENIVFIHFIHDFRKDRVPEYMFKKVVESKRWHAIFQKVSVQCENHFTTGFLRWGECVGAYLLNATSFGLWLICWYTWQCNARTRLSCLSHNFYDWG